MGTQRPSQVPVMSATTKGCADGVARLCPLSPHAKRGYVETPQTKFDVLVLWSGKRSLHRDGSDEWKGKCCTMDHRWQRLRGFEWMEKIKLQRGGLDEDGLDQQVRWYMSGYEDLTLDIPYDWLSMTMVGWIWLDIGNRINEIYRFNEDDLDKKLRTVINV